MTYKIFLTAFVSVFLNALAQIFLRKTMLSLGALPHSLIDFLDFSGKLILNFWFISGMSCYAVSIAVWMVVLGKMEVSIAYPLLSMGYVIATIIGYYYLGESVNLIRLAGLAFICIGIFVISRS